MAGIVVVIAAAGTGLAACGSSGADAQPPASGPAATAASAAPADAVVARAFCGVRQVYWRGSWWRVQPPAADVRGEGEQREVSGTMTPTGPGRARLDSPELVGSETLADTGVHAQNQPPEARCGP